MRLPWFQGTKPTPAKVELLLDEEALNEIRGPILALQKLMKIMFKRAVNTVPGGEQNRDSLMDIDDDTPVITGLLEQQSQLRAASGVTAQILSPSEAETIARLLEEKNIHCLFRLISRVVQLLNLLTLLRQADDLHEMSGVDWGLLHGITFAQLVQTFEGQERLESLLNSLVTGLPFDGVTGSAPSARADSLADQLKSDCYLYFSSGSYSAYLGFRYANEALACPMGSKRRVSLASSASDHLKNAAQHWYSASLISGRIVHTNNQETIDQVALRARGYNSPLEKAMNVLIRLGDICNAVEVSLITASNFQRGWDMIDRSLPLDGSSPLPYPWELNLYHKRQDDMVDEIPRSHGQSSPTQVVGYGAKVTAKDAIDTCYSLIFFYLSELIESSDPRRYNMISKCAAAPDPEFLDRFYSFLLHRYKADLLLIESSDLEAWLRKRNDPEIVLDYYKVQKRYIDAGRMSLEMALDASVQIPLERRISFLDSALAAFRSTEPTNQSPVRTDVAQKVQEVSDMLQVAKIQQKILTQITSAKADLTKERIERLSTSIVDATELFNDFAASLCLFEDCLLLLHACRHEDDPVIRFNWKGVICEELLPCDTRSEIAHSYLQNFVSDLHLGDEVRLLTSDEPTAGAHMVFESGDWSARLEERIVNLGKILYSSGADYVFPVGFLLNTLQGDDLQFPGLSVL
jgi:nuclear pore complex protein Nup155